MASYSYCDTQCLAAYVARMWMAWKNTCMTSWSIWRERSGENPVVLITVDTDFPYADSFFASANREFGRCTSVDHRRDLFCLAGSAIAFIMHRLCSLPWRQAVWMERETKIRLYWIDRVKTEVIFVAQLLFVVLTTVAAMQIVYGEWKIPGMLTMAGTMTYVCDSVFLALYLSLVRRVKSGNALEEQPAATG